MDCKQIREVLDLYVDRELATETMAAASRHLADCARCRRAEAELLRMRQAVKAAVSQYQVPERLEQRIRSGCFHASRRYMVPVFASLLAFVLMAALIQVPVVREFAAASFERFAFRLDQPRVVVIEGRIICRDCELKRMYGAKVHSEHGALETADGKIWSLMEDAASEALIHNPALQGKTIRVRGKIYRRAGCVEVESYEVL